MNVHDIGKCTQCHSYAVNPSLGDRKDDPDNKDLCDVCYWKVKYLELKKKYHKHLGIAFIAT